jgi:dTDP-4-dehydrorhamnose reductase
MKVLVLGATGMLGHKMFQLLRRRFPNTFCTIRGDSDDECLRRVELFQEGNVISHVTAEDFPALEELLRNQRPQTVVNCIGVIKQRPEAKDAIPCCMLNTVLPHRLAALCAEWGGRLIHFSTDCVFSGKRGGYVEDDTSDAGDLYGTTKYLGEVIAGNVITLRTSIIGRELIHRQSLLEWFLSQNQMQVLGYRRALYSGVTTNHLAGVVGDLIEFFPGLSGLYQVVSQTISKHDLLCLLREAYALNIEIVPDEAFVCDRSLQGDKFRRATGYRCPPWPELIANLASDRTPYKDWRNSC